MPSAECVRCGRASADAFLCPACVGVLLADLRAVPELVVELDTTMARLHRIGAPTEARGEALPYHGPSAEARWILRHVLKAWVLGLAAKRGLPAAIHLHVAGPVELARWIEHHVDAVRLDDEGGQCADEIADAVAVCRRTIDRPPDLLVAGQCGAEGCPTVLYVPAGAARVRCRACGAEHEVAERREDMLARAADQLVTAAVALSWCWVLLRSAVPRGTFDSWTSRGRLLAHGRDYEGRLLYRFGDVRDLAADRLARRRAA